VSPWLRLLGKRRCEEGNPVMIQSHILLLVLGMGLVTYLPRWGPLFLLSGRNLPPWLAHWLDLIPVAILSALVAPELLLSGNPPQLDLLQSKLWVALPTFLFAMWSKSLGGTVLFGMFLYWAVGMVL
jgi:branched-subunit amino acid transport protein